MTTARKDLLGIAFAFPTDELSSVKRSGPSDRTSVSHQLAEAVAVLAHFPGGRLNAKSQLIKSDETLPPRHPSPVLPVIIARCLRMRKAGVQQSLSEKL